MGLEVLAVDAKLNTHGIDFAARLRSALASGNTQGTIRPVGTGEAARYSGASPLEFTAELDIARLEPFTTYIDTPILVRGAAQARLRGAGTISDPQITGPVTADGLAITLPDEGIALTGGTLRAMLTTREIRIESFSIRGGEGVLTAQGTLARLGFNQATLDWQAERFRVLARPDRRLVVSGKGNAGLKSGKLSFAGKLRANEGLFDIGETRLPTLGSDVVIVGRTAPQSQQKAKEQRAQRGPALSGVALDLAVDLGNQVEVRGQGLQVWLSGDVRVYTNERGVILASGRVNARNGTFVAYGRRLEIDRGQLYFNGPLSNPALDIVAMRKRQAVEAGVAIGGTLNNPVVRVVSDPPVPEGEALSWLILGRAPNQASAGELSALPLATGALLGKATGSIAKKLGVDELGLSSNSGGVSEQFLTVGKRLTDRLYVFLEQSLGGAESLLRLEYELTQRIAVRAQAGTTSSLGVFYRYRWD
jgi:translocation and assembly module TamB